MEGPRIAWGCGYHANPVIPLPWTGAPRRLSRMNSRSTVLRILKCGNCPRLVNRQLSDHHEAVAHRLYSFICVWSSYASWRVDKVRRPAQTETMGPGFLIPVRSGPTRFRIYIYKEQPLRSTQ